MYSTYNLRRIRSWIPIKVAVSTSNKDSLAPSLNRGVQQGLWQIARVPIQTKPLHNTVLATGFEVLDSQLHLGGWPLSTTTELGFDLEGLGELRLLLPALRKHLQATQDNLIWIAPPHHLNAKALLKEQIDSQKLTLVEAKTKADILWCAEQTLNADCCSAVFTWTGHLALDQRESRRLQLATERSRSWHVQFRDSRCLQHASAAKLRLHLKNSSHNQLAINVVKQPGGWGGQKCVLSLAPAYEQWQRIPPQSLPLHNRYFTQGKSSVGQQLLEGQAQRLFSKD